VPNAVFSTTIGVSVIFLLNIVIKLSVLYVTKPSRSLKNLILNKSKHQSKYVYCKGTHLSLFFLIFGIGYLGISISKCKNKCLNLYYNISS